MTMCIAWDGYELFLEDQDMAVTMMETLGSLGKHGEAGYYTVDVQFNDGGRIYTYLAGKQYGAGQIVTVPTPDGDKTVKVVGTKIRTRKELEKKCPFSQYKTIKEVS